MKKFFKVYLKGKHSTRTPMAYSAYRDYFIDKFTFINDINLADIVVFGYITDIKENFSELYQLKQVNPDIKFVILSEEPIWDTIWSGDFTKIKNSITHKDLELDYYFLNHETTDIFNFNTIPYFITTSNDYFLRYSYLFKRNTKLSAEDIFNIWKTAKYKKVFISEKREKERYDSSFPQINVYGLAKYRTQLAQSCSSEGVLIQGKGWESNKVRQKLPDWHLDKISSLDQKSYIVSALENTHHENYVSEKIFDAYAVLGVPIYYASPNHKVYDLIHRFSLINLWRSSIEEATIKLDEFSASTEFIEIYMQSQAQLCRIFSKAHILSDERMMVVEKIYEALQSIYTKQ